jgi:hypothetical protein
MMSRWSPPVQNARPVPVTRTDRTLARVRSVTNASVSSR